VTALVSPGAAEDLLRRMRDAAMTALYSSAVVNALSDDDVEAIKDGVYDAIGGVLAQRIATDRWA
jgi:hypothetical protein